MADKLKILLADDSPTQAAFLKMALVRKGYEVVLAKDGIEAVEGAFRELPDLLVSDIVMPRLNGYQVCRLLKDDQTMSGMPIVLLTSLDEKADIFWGLKSGADLYLTKVNDVGSLVEDIESFIRKKGLTPRAGHAPTTASQDASLLTRDIIERVIQLLDKSLFESTVLNNIADLVNILEDYKKIMFSVLEILAQVIDFDLGMVYLSSDEGGEFFFYVNGPITEEYIKQAKAAGRTFLLRESHSSSLPEEVESSLYDPQGYLVNLEGQRADRFATAYHKKLTTKGLASGAIGLFSGKENAFSEKILNTFGITVHQANIVIDYAKLYEKNKQLSITDGLTKVYNHRYFQESLKKEFARCIRHKSSMALVILDIDLFKKFNDTYGHQQGDVILAELARSLKHSLRSLDTVSRYGGEEFTIIMPDAGLVEAYKVAERLRRSVEDHAFPGPASSSLKVTVSMGVAAVPHPLICNPAQLINAADQALYKAKKDGRNRVEQAL